MMDIWMVNVSAQKHFKIQMILREKAYVYINNKNQNVFAQKCFLEWKQSANCAIPWW